MSRVTHLVKPGDVIAGKYRVERLIGEGGMGVVFAARQLELDRAVALKLLGRDAVGHGDARARFLREARAAAALDTEHAVRVLDTGTLDDGTPFIAMERLEGCDLGAAIKALGALPSREASLCVVQACRALAEAHARGIVHRDIKPSNLFVARRFDGSERIVILDFGISKAVGNEGAPLDLTHTRETMGSPMYMSPEQVRSSKHVDARTDVWSLGVVLYELLAGVPPFVAPSITALAAMIVEESPRPLADCRPELSSELTRIVHRCLAKSPEERFASATELAAALAPFAAGAELHIAARVAAQTAEAPPNSRADTLPASSLEPRLPDPAPQPTEPREGTRAPVSREVTGVATRVPLRSRALAALGFVLAASAVGYGFVRFGSGPHSNDRTVQSSSASPVPTIAGCVEVARHSYRRMIRGSHATIASGLEHGLFVDWGISLDGLSGRIVTEDLALSVPMPPDAKLAPLSLALVPNASLLTATGTLHDDVFVVSAFRSPHPRIKNAEISRWIALAPDAGGTFSSPLGVRIADQLTTDLGVASAVKHVTAIGLGDRIDPATGKGVGYEVRVASMFGKGNVNRVVREWSGAHGPVRVMGTSAPTRPIAVLSGHDGVSAFALADGDLAFEPAAITSEAPRQTVAASRHDEGIVSWVDRTKLVRVRVLPEGSAAFGEESTLPLQNVDAIALAAHAGTIAFAWSAAADKGQRVRIGASERDVADAVNRAGAVEVDGEVLAITRSARAMWLVYGGAASLGLVVFSCGK